ncbi:MAG: methyltransferase [Polyangiales bacterium]
MSRARSFDPGSRNALTRHDLARFPGESLFDRIGRALCEAECLPRKELYESWEVARRVRRRIRGRRVVDLACGHGLVAHLMLLLDDSSPSAIAVDTRLPESAARIGEALVRSWPRLAGRITTQCISMDEVPATGEDLIVSAHACGALTDRVLDKAMAVRAPVAVLPCCHDVQTCDLGGLGGWLDPALAIDATRAARLREARYRVITQTIPDAITAKNRLLVAIPNE